MQTVDSIIDQVKTLPPAPKILPELLNLLNQDDVPAENVEKLIAYDPALTIKVLQRCNSTSYGLAEPASDLDTAIRCLGFNEIYRIVTTVVLESSLGKAQKGYGIGEGHLWEHSVVSAIGARLVAKDLGENENLAFTSGLLHDVGKLVLGNSLEDAYGLIFKGTEGDQPSSFMEMEKQILGVNHAEVGGRILARWKFPEGIARPVEFHHDPLMAKPFERLASIVYMGDMISHLLGYSHGHQAYAIRGKAEVTDILEITPRDIEQFVVKTAIEVSEASWFMPKKP
jgi:putative nucleotidyltransferase with HDIG domain